MRRGTSQTTEGTRDIKEIFGMPVHECCWHKMESVRHSVMRATPCKDPATRTVGPVLVSNCINPSTSGGLIMLQVHHRPAAHTQL